MKFEIYFPKWKVVPNPPPPPRLTIILLLGDSLYKSVWHDTWRWLLIFDVFSVIPSYTLSQPFSLWYFGRTITRRYPNPPPIPCCLPFSTCLDSQHNILTLMYLNCVMCKKWRFNLGSTFNVLFGSLWVSIFYLMSRNSSISQCFLNVPLPYFYMAQHTNWRDEKFDCVTP